MPNSADYLEDKPHTSRQLQPEEAMTARGFTNSLLRNDRALFYVLSIAILIATAPVYAITVAPTSVVRLDPDLDQVTLGGDMHYLVDATGNLKWLDVLSPANAMRWKPVGGDTPSFGYSDDTYWLGTRLISLASEPRDYLLEIEYPMPDVVNFHVVRNGRLDRVVHTGDQRPFSTRPIDHTTFVFPLKVAAGESCDLLLEVRSSSSIQVPVILWSPEAYQNHISDRYSINGLFYGIMLSIVLYSLSLFITLRERNNLYFMGYIAFFAIMMMSLDGMGFQYFWPRSTFIQGHILTFCLAIVTGAGTLFADNFLHLAALSPRMHRWLKVFGSVVAVTAVVSWFVPYAVAIRMILWQPVVATSVILVTAIRMWRCGSRPALLFSMAWIAMLAGTCLMIFAKIGLYPPSVLTQNGPTLGMLAQAALMIVAMAEDLKASRREKRKATKELLKIQEESGRKLRKEVQLQTTQVQDVMRQLAQANEELDHRNKLDGLTGIFNRHAFDERLEMEFGRGQRTDSHLSLLMIDIDLFKNFNDTYGHLVGDDCLKMVAETIEVESRVTTDFAARYGGEEFAVILAETSGDAAVLVGERVRGAIEAMDFRVDGERVPVTVSVGTGCLKPAECEQEDAVVAMADVALYKAKEAGRNCVKLSLEMPASEPV